MDRHVRGEGIRWLAAASIVAAICGVTALVRVWPAATGPVAPPATPLAARALMLFDAPAPPPVASVTRTATARHDAPVAAARTAGEPISEPAAALAAADMLTEPAAAPATAVTSEPLVAAADAPAVLASRHIEMVFMPADEAPAPAETRLVDPSRPFVELPAVAVTRAVTFAGRRIRSGLRATTAVVRAAF